MIVVDASVAIKWFVPDVGWEAALAVLRSDEELAAPSHIAVETGRGLLRHRRNGDMSAEQARRRLTSVFEVVRMVPTETLVVTVFDIANVHSKTIYDALYVALAALEDCMFVTADMKLANGLRGSPLGKHVVGLADWR